MKVDIFSDVACPWCYIGHARFAKAAERFRAKGGRLEVTMRPFLLNPDAPQTGEPLMEALERKFGPNFRAMSGRVAEAGAEEGLEFDFEHAVHTSTAEAHRLIEVAGRQGLGHEMADRLFRAYFTEGLNVGDAGVLARLAAEVGVKDTGEGADEVRSQLQRARALGITGVPLFLFEDKYSVSGAQPAEVFDQVLDEVAERTGQVPLAPAADGCDDGYCAV
ncbi:DsbA family protein [Nonomuraea sp. NPDC050328]|uniref:DsbA family protein n=1 Tax=Nonomuraea sp. NPDC050328 TaxID=3364361 RepID=UPI0037892FAE